MPEYIDPASSTINTEAKPFAARPAGQTSSFDGDIPMRQAATGACRTPAYLLRTLLHRIATLILIAISAVLSIDPAISGEIPRIRSVPNIVLILADDLGYIAEAVGDRRRVRLVAEPALAGPRRKHARGASQSPHPKVSLLARSKADGNRDWLQSPVCRPKISRHGGAHDEPASQSLDAGDAVKTHVRTGPQVDAFARRSPCRGLRLGIRPNTPSAHA